MASSLDFTSRPTRTDYCLDGTYTRPRKASFGNPKSWTVSLSNEETPGPSVHMHRSDTVIARDCSIKKNFQTSTRTTTSMQIHSVFGRHIWIPCKPSISCDCASKRNQKQNSSNCPTFPRKFLVIEYVPIGGVILRGEEVAKRGILVQQIQTPR